MALNITLPANLRCVFAGIDYQAVSISPSNQVTVSNGLLARIGIE